MENKEAREIQEEKMDGGAVKPPEGDGGIYCLSIIGQIEGHYALESNQKATKYDHVVNSCIVCIIRMC